jgi:nucleoside-diphosphate-sugar epimerase
VTRVFIIGGTGFIGSAVAQRLAESGAEVVLFNRAQTDASPDFEQIVGDVARLPDYKDQLRDVKPDAIVHTIAYTEGDAERARATFAGLDCPLVVLGSQDCYAGFHGWQAGRELTDFPMDEDSPLADPHYWRKLGHPSHDSAEEYDKNRMTSELLAAHRSGELAPIILRVPMVWGPKDSGFEHRHGDIIWHLLDHREHMVMGEREQGQIWTFGYIDNVAAAIVHAISTAPAGSIFNVGEHKVRTKRRWAELYAAAADHILDVRIAPDALLLPGNEQDAPTFHLINDNTAFARATGFTEPVPLDAAMKATLVWAQDHPDQIGSRPDYDARTSAADSYERAVSSLA